MGDVKYNWSDKYRPRKPRCVPIFSRSCGRGCVPFFQCTHCRAGTTTVFTRATIGICTTRLTTICKTRPRRRCRATSSTSCERTPLAASALSVAAACLARSVCGIARRRCCHAAPRYLTCSLPLGTLTSSTRRRPQRTPPLPPPFLPPSTSASLSSSQPLSFSYRITRDKDVDTCIITFHAGPPYEDIAFRSPPPPPFLSPLIIWS